MNYTKPLILKTEKAVFAIQQVGSNLPSKPVGQFLDQVQISCTAAAYEADE